MKITVKSILSILFIGLSLVSVLGQQSQETPKSKLTTKETESLKQKEYEGWQKIDLEELSFYLPKELKQVPAQGYDSKVYSFENHDSVLNISIDNSLSLTGSFKGFKNYSEKPVTIEKTAWGWMRFFETGNEYNYTSNVKFRFFEVKNYEISMSLFHKNSKDSETAKKIFESVKFNLKDKSTNQK